MAEMLAAEGCIVCVHGRDAPRANEVAKAIGAAGVALGDLSTPEGAEAAADAAFAVLGGVDILINNAGGSTRGSSSQSWLAVEEVDWIDTYQSNAMAAVRMIRRFVPGMKEAGWGRIIQITSAVQITSLDYSPPMCSSPAIPRERRARSASTSRAFALP